MVIRKLQKNPKGSFMVCVPKSWVDKKELKAQDSIEILFEEDGSLRLFPVDKPFEREYMVTINFEEYPSIEALAYSIRTYYMQGVDKIAIVSKSPIPAEEKKKIHLIRSELLSSEVREEADNRLGIEIFFRSPTSSLESLIKESFAHSIQLYKDAVESVLKNDIALGSKVLERREESLKNYRAAIRQISLSSLSRFFQDKAGVRDCQECVTFAFTARDIDRLAYHSASIAKQLVALDGREIDEKVLSVMSDMSKIVFEMENEAVEAFLRKDPKLAIAVMSNMSKVRKLEEQLIKTFHRTKDIEPALSTHNIVRALRRIAGHSVAIADSAMNRALSPACHSP